MAGLMQPGPTLYEAEQQRKKKGSRGLLGEVGEPLSYAPGPVGLLGNALLAAQYATGEKPMDEGLSGMAMLTALANGTRVAPIMRPIFAGEKALTANRDKLKTAQELDSAGADRQFIWDKTGWYKGGDGKWRFEIDDRSAHFGNKHGNVDNFVLQKERDPLSEVNVEHLLRHDQLTGAYPGTKQIGVSFNPRSGGSYSGPSSIDPEHIELGTRSKDTLLHELQHAIQQREGFARGGSPKSVAADLAAWEYSQAEKRIAELFAKPHVAKAKARFDELKAQWGSRQDEMPKELVAEVQAINAMPERQEIARLVATQQANLNKARSWGTESLYTEKELQDAYRRLAGEVEARNVQARMNMTPAERALLPPWSTEDVPAEQQIIRGLLGK